MREPSARRWFVYAFKGDWLFSARVSGDELTGTLSMLRALRYRRIYRRRLV